MRSVTLIIDKRLELSTKYKKLLENDSNKVIVSKDMISSIKIIQEKEPDLIIISDSVDNELSDFCKQIRALTYNMRPIIVGLSKSADFDDRIKVLDSGADDFLSEPVNLEEFKVRMFAHLRREYETNSDLIPNKNYTLRAIKRVLSEDKIWSILYVKIENFESYKQIYTKLASDKLLQTFITIMKSALDLSDYIGYVEENIFVIITDSIKAEKISRFLIFAFDSVASKFYAEQDLERGYLILQGDDFAGKRSNFVHLTISGVSNESNKYKDTMQIMTALVELNKMASVVDSSNFLLERPKIQGVDSIYQKLFNNNILIYEPDEALSLLLNTILKLQGYKTTVCLDYEIPEILEEIPALVIIDAGDLEKKNGLNLCYKLKQLQEFEKTKIIVTSIIHDKELVLNTGADLYIPKPYEVTSLIKWVSDFIEEYNEN